MKRRRTLACPATAVELELVGAMMRASGLRSEADVVRTALWNYARHLDIDVSVDVFALEDSRGRRRRSA